MTEIRFLRDYRGKLTQEYFYEAGSTGQFDPAVASQIIAEGAAELVEAPPVEVVEEKPATNTTRRTKTTKAK